MTAALFSHHVEPGVRIVGVPWTHPRAGACVVVRTEGLAARGFADVAFVVPEAALEASVTDALRLLSTVVEKAKQQPLDVGDPIVLRNRRLFDTFGGATLAKSAQLPGVLVAVPLHDDELATLGRCGAARVLARLASLTRAWPFPEPIDRARPPCIRLDDIESSRFGHGMPVAGPCSVTLQSGLGGGRVMCALGARAATALLDALRGGRPFVAHAPLDDDRADGVLVFNRADQPPGVFSPGPIDTDARVAGTFIAVTLGGDPYRGAAQVEDGVAVVLTPTDARRLCGALETGTPLFLDDPAAGRMKLTLRCTDGAVSSDRPITRRVFLTALQLLDDAAVLAEEDVVALARFHDAVVAAVDAAVVESDLGAGVEIRTRVRREPGRAGPRVLVLQSDEVPAALVADIGDALCALPAPPAKAALGFEAVFLTT